MAYNENDGLDFIISKKYLLTERVLNKIMDDIYDKTGVNVICYETENGYVFKDEKFLIPVGELKFNVFGGQYGDVRLYEGGVEEVKIREAEEQRAYYQARREERAEQRRKRKLKLQVGGAIASVLALTIAGTSVLMDMGVIDTPFKPHKPTIETTVSVAEAPALNTINNASDVLLVEWMNYAMGQVDDICSSSSYEYFQTLQHEVYTEYFAPAMSAYYAYLDYRDAGLPLSSEFGDEDLLGKAHDRFVNAAMTFANYLKDSAYFNKITFGASPLANAIVTDKAGNPLVASDSVRGALVTEDGKTVSTREDCDINIRIIDIENSPYSLENLPNDVRVINGEVYVGVSHMYQDYGSYGSPSK